jgi:ParB/RepB/Spo0J family partition protein
MSKRKSASATVRASGTATFTMEAPPVETPGPIIETAAEVIARIEHDFPIDAQMEDAQLSADPCASYAEDSDNPPSTVDNDNMKTLEATANNGDSTIEVDAPTQSISDEGVLRLRQGVIDAGPDYVFSLNLADIIIDPTRNGRTDERKTTDPDVKALAENIKLQGQMMPGEVHLDTDGSMYLTYGFGRAAAIQLINSTRTASDQLLYKAFIKLDIDSTTARDRNFSENHQRKELTVLDRAKVVTDYKTENPKMEGKEIARRTGLSPATVSNYLKIAGPLFSEKVKKYIKEGKLPQRGAVELCKFKSAEEIDKAAEEMVTAVGPSGTVTTRDVKKKTRAAQVGKGAINQRTAKEIMDVIDYVFEKKNVKMLNPTVTEICRIFADIINGRLSQEKTLEKLSAYK